MKFYIHYTIWNKSGHIPWICDGIKTSAPKNSIIDITFDNCIDDSIKNFETCLRSRENEYGSLKGFIVNYRNSEKKLRWPNTNDALERFMKSDCDLFFSPQDDMKIQDKFVYKNLENLYMIEGVGMVGMRDGIVMSTNQFYSSSHSPGGGHTTIWLRSGEYKEVDYVNDGPICLNKNAVEKVGLFDLEYWAHFGDNDYCFRATQNGLQNYVMGAEIVHEKWGNVQPSEVWNQEYSLHDHEVYNRKWGK